MPVPPRREALTDRRLDLLAGFRPYTLLPWVLVLLLPLHDVLGGRNPRPVAEMAGLGLFAGLYCAIVLSAFRPRLRHVRLPVALTVVAVPVAGALAGSLAHGVVVYPLLAAAAAVVLPEGGAPLAVLAAPALAALTALMRSQFTTMLWASLGTFLAGALVLTRIRLAATAAELRAARRTAGPGPAVPPQAAVGTGRPARHGGAGAEADGPVGGAVSGAPGGAVSGGAASGGAASGTVGGATGGLATGGLGTGGAAGGSAAQR